MTRRAIFGRLAHGRPTRRVRWRGRSRVFFGFRWHLSLNESQVVCSSSLFGAMAVLETSRLTLRPFREDDVDLLSELMANQDFMRFSLGVYTREQTQAVLDKILSWNRAGLPSQFAVVIQTGGKLIGYCGFFHQVVDEKNEIEIGYRLHPDYWN